MLPLETSIVVVNTVDVVTKLFIILVCRFIIIGFFRFIGIRFRFLRFDGRRPVENVLRLLFQNRSNSLLGSFRWIRSQVIEDFVKVHFYSSANGSYSSLVVFGRANGCKAFGKGLSFALSYHSENFVRVSAEASSYPPMVLPSNLLSIAK